MGLQGERPVMHHGYLLSQASAARLAPAFSPLPEERGERAPALQNFIRQWRSGPLRGAQIRLISPERRSLRQCVLAGCGGAPACSGMTPGRSPEANPVAPSPVPEGRPGDLRRSEYHHAEPTGKRSRPAQADWRQAKDHQPAGPQARPGQQGSGRSQEVGCQAGQRYPCFASTPP